MRPSSEDNRNEDNMLQLYEAAFNGSVANLKTLIRNDPLILHKVSLTSFTKTPLHISALAGHLEFTEAPLTQKSQRATRLDSLNRSPLHLPSAEGHTDVVKALLRANLDVCLVPDEEGRIPLHLVVMRGQVEVIQELIHAQPNSVLEKLHGDTVLHLAVKYNQLTALRKLVTQLNEEEILDFTDHQGNTILHSAVILKQSEIIRYLVSVSKVKANINVLNGMGFNAMDLLEHYPRDFKCLEIGDILIRAGGERSSTQDPNPQDQIYKKGQARAQMVPVVVGETQVHTIKPGSSNLGLKGKAKLLYRKCKIYLKHQSNWGEEMHGTLMLVATLTATISFQVAISPPGGVWQQDYTNSTAGEYNCTVHDKCAAGRAVLGYVYPDLYQPFTRCAIISFIASLSVVLLAISGLPLKNKLCTWLMTIAMIFAITSLLLTFISAVIMVTPDFIFSRTRKELVATENIWLFLVGVIVVFATIRLLFWLFRLLIKSIPLVRKIM